MQLYISTHNIIFATFVDVNSIHKTRCKSEKSFLNPPIMTIKWFLWVIWSSISHTKVFWNKFFWKWHLMLLYIYVYVYIYYNENPCAWLLWHWSSRGQLALCNPPGPLGRVGSKFNWPSEDQCQRSHSKWVFVFIPHLKGKNNQLIVSKLSRKSAIGPRRSPWQLIVLVRSLRSVRLDTAWLVKSVTYFNLIG